MADGTYRMATRQSLTFRTISRLSIDLSLAEIFPRVELLKAIPTSERTPALSDVAVPRNEERWVLSVRQHIMVLEKE